ncbi:MAG: twitching motility protein PilT [Candidatus Paceibacteria bacterium]|jgi:twitching motility protein PilT
MDHKQELKDLMQTVITQAGSDIHLSEGDHPTLRINEELIPLVNKEVLDDKTVRGLLNELITSELYTEFKENNELDFAYQYGDGTRFRGSAFIKSGTVGIVLRVIPQKIRTLQELNLPQSLEMFGRKKQGFFLAVGPVGVGKSTTLAAIINQINNERAEHIVTIERPIEYIYTKSKSIVTQREVPSDTKDFQTGLTGAFRQDVNVILVGEMRDKETIAAAVSAAETGHLVFSTLHTNNAPQTINRIIDSFPAEQQDQIRIQLAGTLTGIFSQRLIPRISGGLIPAYELLINNTAVSNLIREKRIHEISRVIETGMGDGMVDYNRSLAELVRMGEITPENAYLYSHNPELLEKLM